MYRIFLRRIEVLRIDDHSREIETILHCDIDKLRQCVLGRIVIRALHISHDSGSWISYWLCIGLDSLPKHSGLTGITRICTDIVLSV